MWFLICAVCSVTQSCPTLCNLMDCSPPGSSVHGISQARILKWVAISFSRGSSWAKDWTWVSCIAGRFFTVWATRETPVTFPFTSIYSLPYSIVCAHSVVSNSVTPRTIACQVPLSMEFSRQEYWSELPFPTPGDLPDPGIEPTFLASSLAGGFFTTVPPESP